MRDSLRIIYSLGRARKQPAILGLRGFMREEKKLREFFLGKLTNPQIKVKRSFMKALLIVMGYLAEKVSSKIRKGFIQESFKMEKNTVKDSLNLKMV
jgi:hypothetical protein